MPSITTEGIIIRRSNYGEADRILTILTPFKGKINVVAKGVRRITSRRGGNVELLNKVRLHLFQGKGMIVLSEAESIETYPKVKNDLTLSSYASHILEVVDRFIPEEQINPIPYNLLASILIILNTHPRQIFIRAFEIKLLSALGFWSIEQIQTSDKIKDILDKLEKLSWQEINTIEIDQAISIELENILRYYMERILESSLKSLGIIKKLKQ